jgi:Zn finger protein HypA/HybF involved in hydrogenase expression
METKEKSGLKLEGRFKPCPMCDGEEVTLWLEGDQQYVRCDECGTDGGWSRSMSGAARFWNMRSEKEFFSWTDECPFCEGKRLEMKSTNREICCGCAAEFPK